MPRKDGTGSSGQGPGTGKGMGRQGGDPRERGRGMGGGFSAGSGGIVCARHAEKERPTNRAYLLATSNSVLSAGRP